MSRGKILVTDPVSPKLLELIGKEGYECDYRPDIQVEELKEVIGGYPCLIVRGRLVLDRDVLMKSDELRLIIRYGVGLDNIDLAHCREKGIKVLNTPKSFTEPVAELALALILGVLRGVGDGHHNIKQGRWIKKRLLGQELLDKTVGIIGFGRIGRRLADLLQPFNVRILAYDIIPVPREYLERGVEQVDIETLLKNSDIISIHVPLTPQTHHMINKERLELCKDGAYIINTSRGGVIDEEALKKHLREGRLGGVALDVFEGEPEPDGELIGMEKTLYTPHIGAQTIEARERAIYEVVEMLREHFK